ncbi:hypothetical protein acdb102_28790 [Acidothermaceae bacterium B102]|nr:hypothetical protein acdb102_28790 [Acidothermaceae bacterium B102]
MTGSVIVGIGIVGLACARDRRDVPLAALPVLLGAHQLIESRIYADSPGDGSVVRGAAVLAWTLIAFVALPLCVPLVLLVAERERRRIQYVAAAVGAVVALVLGVAVFRGVHATDHGHVMEYGATGIPWLPVVLAGYLFATCVPFLTSYERTMRELGVALAIGAALAAAISLLAFASIWCGFAAAVSVLIVRRTIHAAHQLPERLL